MLHAIADSICLKKLGGIKHTVKILRIQVSRRQIFQYFPVCCPVSLMHLHHSGENVAVLLKGKAFHRPATGEGLEAKL